MAFSITLQGGALDGERQVIDDLTPDIVLDTDDGPQRYVRTGGAHSVGPGPWIYSYVHAPEVA